mgnify:CR=1 FL=1
MVKNIADYEVSEDAFNLRDTLQRALETLEAVYERYGVPLPARRYWVLGRPAEDCEQAVVSFVQLYLGAPGDQASTPQHCNVAPRSVVLEITVTRNYPIGNNGKAVAAADLIKASEWGAIDSWILMESAADFDKWDDAGYGPGVISTVTPNDPAGGLQTVIMNLTVAVP